MSSSSLPPGAPLHIPSPAPPLVPAKTSGLAIAALVLALIPFLGWLAVILGIVALVGIAKPARRQSGKGLAIAGIILGALQALLVVPALLVAMLLPALGAARGQARLTMEMSNLRQIGVGMQMYAVENDGKWPLHAGQTVTMLGGSLKVFVSPDNRGQAPPTFDASRLGAAPLATPYRFGDYYFTVSGDRSSRVREPSRFVLAYSQPQSGARTRRAVLFADSHAERCDDAQFAKLLADQARLRADAGLPPLGPQSP